MFVLWVPIFEIPALFRHTFLETLTTTHIRMIQVNILHFYVITDAVVFPVNVKNAQKPSHPAVRPGDRRLLKPASTVV